MHQAREKRGAGKRLSKAYLIGAQLKGLIQRHLGTLRPLQEVPVTMVPSGLHASCTVKEHQTSQHSKEIKCINTLTEIPEQTQ